MIRDHLAAELRRIVGEKYLLVEKEDVIVYEADGSILQALPEIVVLPGQCRAGLESRAPASALLLTGAFYAL